MKTKITSCAKQIRGVSYKPTDLHKTLDSESTILFRANNIKNGEIDFDDVVYVDKKCISKEQYLRHGDILICASSGSKNLVGKAAQINFDGEYTFGAFCKVVRPDGIDSDFLGAYFQSPMYNHIISALSQGANINNIRNEHIDGLEIPVFSDDAQSKIVQTLKSLNICIKLAKSQLEKLDTLVKSRFIEMFGDPNEMDKWPCCKVKDVADVTVGLVIKPTRFYTDDIKNGIKAFRSLNVREMRVNDSDWVYFSQDGNDQNKKSQLQKGDVLIVRSGYPGTSCVVTDDYEGCNAIDIIIARPKQDIINPYYLCAFNNFPHGMNQIRHGTGGAAQKHFNVGAYNNVTIPLPPKEEQNKFVEFMQQADKSKLVIQKLLEKQETLRAALMQEYFG